MTASKFTLSSHFQTKPVFFTFNTSRTWSPKTHRKTHTCWDLSSKRQHMHWSSAHVGSKSISVILQVSALYLMSTIKTGQYFWFSSCLWFVDISAILLSKSRSLFSPTWTDNYEVMNSVATNFANYLLNDFAGMILCIWNVTINDCWQVVNREQSSFTRSNAKPAWHRQHSSHGR